MIAGRHLGFQGDVPKIRRQDAGLWDQIHRHMPGRPNLAGEIDWPRAGVDASSMQAKRGDDAIGPNPTVRDRPGTKRHA